MNLLFKKHSSRSVFEWKIYILVIDGVHGGIALTSSPCHKKQTSDRTKKVRSVIKRTAKWPS